jgi:hypothetical protein
MNVFGFYFISAKIQRSKEISKKKDKKVQIITFFEKKQEKVWWVSKKALPLHPQSREMHLPKRF